MTVGSSPGGVGVDAPGETSMPGAEPPSASADHGSRDGFRLTDPLIWTVRGYQRLISRFTPPVCRFTPSCSSYAIGALRGHGVFRGSLLAAWRILRCNPFFPGGYDPVPPAGPGAAAPSESLHSAPAAGPCACGHAGEGD